MHLFRNIITSYNPLLKYLTIFLLVGASFRIVLLILFTDSFSIDILYSLLYGIKMDIMYFSLVMLFTIWFYLFNFILFARYIIMIFATVYIVFEVGTIFYFDIFNTRPDILVVEHLEHSFELFLTMVKLYPILIIVSLFFSYYLINQSSIYVKKTLIKSKIRYKLILFPFVLFFTLFGIRQSFGVATPNQSNYTFSSSMIYNNIANTTIFSIGYDIYLDKMNMMYDYGTISNEDPILNIQKISSQIKYQDNATLLHKVESITNSKQKNIILIILESFGHTKVGHLGGLPLTPNLDKIASKGLSFTSLYAVGYRTSWGVASILSSLYPNPNSSYLQLINSKNNFFTMAKPLKDSGYNNIFLYGGEVSFDNMSGFMLANGYDKIYSSDDFDKSISKYTWGYSDEALYDKAYKIIKKQKDKKYSLTLLTLSNHEPFDYPKDKVQPYKKAKLNGFENAVKYSDWALGNFFDRLNSEGLLDNTVIAFIADHNDSTYGNSAVPITKYKIPAVIYTKDIVAQKYSKIASQIDFAPTVLDVAGISYLSPTMGDSIFKEQKDSALLLYHKRFALLKSEYYVIYQIDKKPQIFNYHDDILKYDRSKIEEGLNYIYGANILYEKGYRLKGKIK